MIRILFLAANPIDQSHLRVRQEFDELRQALDSAQQGRCVELIQEFAAAANQLQDLLFRHRPQIVHFSGHGTAGGLVFEGADGSSHLVAPQTLRDLFANFKQQVRCVVLNACYSETQATAIATVIDSVVGMGDALTDDAALAFAVAFHRALANGTTLADAVALGRNQLDLQNLDEAHKPKLLAERIDAGQVRALDWDDNAPATAATPGPTTTINSSGGTVVDGDVKIGEGDFINRDKIVIQQQTNIYQTVASANPSVASQESVVFVPFPRKAATEFVGRDAELVELHEKLQQSQMVGVRPAAALTGLGGIGKTQLAVEYAYRYGASYPGGIFWINAAALNGVRSGLVETAERMGLRTDHSATENALLAALVKRCQQQPATLLCFDNAPDAVILWRRLTQELNTATLGAAILITTRRRELPPHMAALDLRRLSDSTVRQLLGTARPDLLTDPDLPRLLERLGGLPLVVSLVANALHNSPDATIADYLVALAQHGEETVHEALDVHVADYDLYREVYTRTLLPVLREQWERLCQQPKSEHAQLLLRIAGQLPEAAEIPIARLGLLAGLEDAKVIKPLTSASQTLWKLALIEELKADAIRLHPLVRDFAKALVSEAQSNAFRTQCAQRLAEAYALEESGLRRLGKEYAKRGIAALLVDLLIAIDLAQPAASTSQSPVTSLQSLLRRLRMESHHLQSDVSDKQPQRLWQQLLPRTAPAASSNLLLHLTGLLRSTWHWLPRWGHQRHSIAMEQTLIGHEEGVCAVVVMNAQRIVSASYDRTLKIWNLLTGQVEQTFVGHEDSVLDVAVLGTHRIVSASEDCTLKVWNLYTGTLEQTLVGHEGGVRAVAVVDTQRIVSASYDNTIKVWNLTTGTLDHTFVGYEGMVGPMAVIDRQRIVFHAAFTLNVWNLLTGQVEQTLVGHKWGVNKVAVLDDQRIVSAATDGPLKVWNLPTGALEQTLIGHEGGGSTVAVVDRQRIVSAAADRTLKVWNLQTGILEQTLVGHEDWVIAIAVVDAQRIVSASSDRTLKIWNLQNGHMDRTFTAHEHQVNVVAVIDGQRIVSASSDRTLKVWNLLTGTLEQTLIGHENGVGAMAVMDALRIVFAADNTLKVWNLLTGVVEQTFVGHESSVAAVAAVNPKRIVSACIDGTIKVWNLLTGQVEQTLVEHEGWVSMVAAAVLDTQHIVSTYHDNTLKIWNLHTGALEQTLVGHESRVRAIAAVDRRIVSASSDCTLKVWNIHTGQVEQTLTGHKDSVNAVAVVDGQRIVSASDDRTLKVWDLTTGQVIASIGLDGALTCVAVTQQGGRTLVVAGDVGGALYCLELVEPVEPDKVNE